MTDTNHCLSSFFLGIDALGDVHDAGRRRAEAEVAAIPLHRYAAPCRNVTLEEVRIRLSALSGMEVTGDPAFSMFNLSLKDDWINNKKFCHRLSDDETEQEDTNANEETASNQAILATKAAQERLHANMSKKSNSNGSTVANGQ